MIKNQEQQKIQLLLLEASDYRQFMQSFIELKRERHPDYGYASLARAAGFTARSFPRDVINGSRQLTSLSLPRFIKAFQLRGETARYFSLLVSRDRPELHNGPQDEIFGLLEKSKKKLQRQMDGKSDRTSKIYSQVHWPLVYASLGVENVGATLEEVSARTNFPADACLQMLDGLRSQNLVGYKSKRYYSQNSHLFFKDLDSESGFKNFFLSSVKRLETQSKKDFEKQDRLFFASAISIKRGHLEKYRLGLQDLLNSFVDSAESPDGDDVVSVVCGLFPNR